MKKHLFLLSSVFAVLSLQAQVATMKVAGNTGVKVKTGTTLYVGGEMKVASYTTNNKVSNEGNIRITEKLTNGNDTDGVNFVNEYVSTGNYGQLIINNGSSTNEGKIASQIDLSGTSDFVDIAIPYKNITAGHLVKEAFNAKGDVNSAFIGYVANRNNKSDNPLYDGNRYKNPLFYWDNSTYTSTQVNASNNNLENPERSYAFSSFSTLGNYSGVRSLSGTPVKDNFSVTVSYYTPQNSKASNSFGEAYGSYIVDFTQPTAPAGWSNYGDATSAGVNANGYGANIYYFGNPYTSNIDISKGEGFIGTGSEVEAIYQSTSYGYNENGEALSNTFENGVSISVLTADGAGKQSAKFVRPFQTFGVKLNLQEGQMHTFTFKDEMKTFSLPNNGVTVINNVFKKNRDISSTPILNQLGIELYDSNGFTGIDTFVVASDIYEASEKGIGIEAYNPAMNDTHTGIYTLQESESGDVDENLIGRTYINGINETKYIGKPIHLVFQNGKGQYTFKAELNETLLNNKNSYYFEDKEEGKVIKIDKNFSYTFNVNGTDKDRFVLYWAALPTQENNKEITEEYVDTTLVFKDQNTYKVRFDKEMKRADVFVYTISGQLINVDKGVNTSNDYIVPVVGNASVYIVKIVGDNGKVITKKIIK